MSLNATNSILVIGIGNPLRSDDGVGAHVVKALEAEGLSQVKTLVLQQLDVELLEEICEYDKILLIDASSLKEDFIFRKVLLNSDHPLVSSHHLSPEVLLHLARKIYKKELNLYMCAIRGESFEMGEELSPVVYERAEQAMRTIRPFLREQYYA